MLKRTAHYGIDAPHIIRNFFIAGLATTVLSFLLLRVDFLLVKIFAYLLLLSALYCIVVAVAMLWSSLFGKQCQARRLIKALNLSGDEYVLDVGCGRGLLLIEVAKQLKTGKAVGSDIWSQEDLSDNSKEKTLANAAIEDVADTVEVVEADVRKMPFEDNSFDAVISSMVIHNIYDPEERKKALKEMVRVLKPNGTLLIQDFQHTQEYAAVLQELGLAVELSGLHFLIFPPVRIVTARNVQ